MAVGIAAVLEEAGIAGVFVGIAAWVVLACKQVCLVLVCRRAWLGAEVCIGVSVVEVCTEVSGAGAYIGVSVAVLALEEVHK